jgi:hypothetical protein
MTPERGCTIYAEFGARPCREGEICDCARNQIPPVAVACATPAGLGSSAAAQEVEGIAPRPAEHSISEQRAVKVMAAHARLAANAQSQGDPERRKRLIAAQGEILFTAGLQLMLEGGGK